MCTIYQPPTKTYRSHSAVVVGIPGHMTTKHLPDTKTGLNLEKCQNRNEYQIVLLTFMHASLVAYVVCVRTTASIVFWLR